MFSSVMLRVLGGVFSAAVAVIVLTICWRRHHRKAARPALICLGHATIDTILRVPQVKLPPVKILATACVQTAGGMATNAATAACRLGARVTLLSRVGSDAAGQAYLAHMALEADLDTGHVVKIRGAKTSISSILVDAMGERLVVPYNDPRLADVDAARVVAGALRAGLPSASLVDVRWPEGAEQLLHQLAVRGCRMRMLDADVAPVEVLRRLAPLATHVIFSEPGLALFTNGLAEMGTPAGGPTQPTASSRLAQAQRALPNAAMVGVTLGAEGFVWVEVGAQQQQRVVAPTVDAEDTLGAGDVFHAALVVGLTEGLGTTRKAVQLACAAAALKCTRFGGRLGAPTRQAADVLARATYGHEEST